MELGLGAFMVLVLELGSVLVLELGTLMGLGTLVELELGLGTVMDMGSRLGKTKLGLGWSWLEPPTLCRLSSRRTSSRKPETGLVAEHPPRI